MFEFEFDLRDTNKYLCSSTQLDSFAAEETKTRVNGWYRWEHLLGGGDHQDGPVTGFSMQRWVVGDEVRMVGGLYNDDRMGCKVRMVAGEV